MTDHKPLTPERLAEIRARMHTGRHVYISGEIHDELRKAEVEASKRDLPDLLADNDRLREELRVALVANEDQRTAILAEREACALIADEYTGGVNHLRQRRAAADGPEGRPVAKSSAEQRADEFVAENAKATLCPINFFDALRYAREAYEDVDRAVAWLVVAQRMLEREAAR